MQIAEATIHHLEKRAHTHGEGSVTLRPRDENLPIDETLEAVCKDLLALYNKSLDSQGTFGADPNVHVFPQRLNDYLTGVLEFQAMTEATMRMIASRMQEVRFATSGYALFLRYSEPPNDFLLIAMLKLKPGAGVDAETLSLLPTLNIDLDLLNEAARINITRLTANTEPYLTFIKGARKKSEITEYFRQAIACTHFTHAAEQTKTLIRAADDFVNQRADIPTQEIRQDVRNRMRRQLHDCLRDNADEVTLETLAAAIHPDAPAEFVEFVRQVDNGERRYPFNDRFRPDKTVVRSIRRIESRFGSVRICFDVADVQSGVVSYDEQRNILTIQDPPDRLRTEVLEYQSDATE